MDKNQQSYGKDDIIEEVFDEISDGNIDDDQIKPNVHQDALK